MNISEALAAPEERIPQDVQDGLLALGHKVKAVHGLGLAHRLAIAYGKNGQPAGFPGRRRSSRPWPGLGVLKTGDRRANYA